MAKRYSAISVVLLVFYLLETVNAISSVKSSMDLILNGRSKRMLPAKDDLVSLFIVCRHSIRAPVFYPPNDEYLSIKNFPRGPSYLTDSGIQASINVGRIWKDWYPTLITENAREVWARSSEAYRCAETAQALLHSMYSSGGQYQPISVIVPPSTQDKYTSSNSLSDEELFKFMDPFYDNEITSSNGTSMTVTDVLDFIKSNFRLEKNTDPYSMFIYLDGLISLQYENLRQPPWYLINRELIDQCYNLLYERLTATLRPYYGYYLLQGLAERMIQVKQGKAKYGQKLNLFTFHDFSMSAVLTNLDQELDTLKASFLGAVFFELHKRHNDGSFYFEIYWSEGLDFDGTYSSKKPLILSNGSNIIEYDKLIDKLQRNIFEEHMTSSKNALLGYTRDDAFV